MKKLKEPETDQLLLDLQEIRERLAALNRLLKQKEGLETEIRERTLALQGLKRKLKEVGWDITALLSQEKRKAKTELPPEMLAEEGG